MVTLGVFVLFGLLVAFGGWRGDERAPRPAEAEPRAPLAAAAESHVTDGTAAIRCPVVAPQAPTEAQGTVLTTFLHGAPEPSVLLSFTTPSFAETDKVDWTEARLRHRIDPDHDVHYAVFCKGAYAQVLRSDDLPREGEHRIDMQPAPSISITLLNVPRGLREKFDLYAKLTCSRHQDDYEKRACFALRTESPGPMPTDHVRIPLAFAYDGMVTVWAQARTSSVGHGVPKVPYNPADPWVEVDVSSLARYVDTTTLRLTLEFPHEHPSGKLDIQVLEADGSGTCHQAFTREPTQRQVTLDLPDLPRGEVGLVLRHTDLALNVPRLYLPKLVLNEHLQREQFVVEAEGRLHATVPGWNEDAAASPSVLVQDEHGRRIVGHSARGGRAEITHLPSGTYYVQAVDFESSRCSHLQKVHVAGGGVADVSLPLVPGGRVLVERPNEPPRFMDWQTWERTVDRHFVPRVGPIVLWCPAGSYDVRWPGGERRGVVVEAGILNELRVFP